MRREAAAEVGYMDPEFFVYYDECDFAKRLAEAGWHSLFVPGAEAVHHDQLSTDLAAGLPRIVEFHRNHNLYMRKHHGGAGGTGGTGPHRLDLRPARPRRHRPTQASHQGLLGPCPPGAIYQDAVRAFGRQAGQARVLVHELCLVGLRDRSVDASGKRTATRRARLRHDSPGCRRRASQLRSLGVKKPVASRARG